MEVVYLMDIIELQIITWKLSILTAEKVRIQIIHALEAVIKMRMMNLDKLTNNKVIFKVFNMLTLEFQSISTPE
jgi:hypothetical protein